MILASRTPLLALIRKVAGPDGKIIRIGETSESVENKLVPYIPRELASDTIEFFRNSSRVKALVELIFSPTKPQDKVEDRVEFEQRTSAYNKILDFNQKRWKEHEIRAAKMVFRTIRQLPSELYDESVSLNKKPIPRELLFHVMYGKKIFNSLSTIELCKLQTFENLMHIRYPHSEMRKRKPELFWVSASQVMSKQQEMAVKSAALARNKKK